MHLVAHCRERSSLQPLQRPHGSWSERMTSLRRRLSVKTTSPPLHWYACNGWKHAIRGVSRLELGRSCWRLWFCVYCAGIVRRCVFCRLVGGSLDACCFLVGCGKGPRWGPILIALLAGQVKRILVIRTCAWSPFLSHRFLASWSSVSDVARRAIDLKYMSSPVITSWTCSCVNSFLIISFLASAISFLLFVRSLLDRVYILPFMVCLSSHF